MKYLGGKVRHGVRVAAFLEAHRRGRLYLEPFVGAAGVFQHMRNPRLGTDVCAPMITLFKRLQGGWRPPMRLTSRQHADLMARNDPDDPMTAFAGFGCSFSGMWFSTFARNADFDNYAAICARSLEAMRPRLVGAEFEVADYRTLRPRGSLIYCDPPYRMTMGYKYSGGFDHVEFWQTVRRWSDANTVFVSEFSAPDDFECVKTWDRTVSIAIGQNRRTVERLFVRGL
jgi:DNA adenine methylase